MELGRDYYLIPESSSNGRTTNSEFLCVYLNRFPDWESFKNSETIQVYSR